MFGLFVVLTESAKFYTLENVLTPSNPLKKIAGMGNSFQSAKLFMHTSKTDANKLKRACPYK